MGFLAGFAGGITLTLSLTYLALHTHSSNRQAQSALLRSQASTLTSLLPPPSDPSLFPLPQNQQRRNATLLLPDGTYRPRASLEAYRREELAHRESEPGFLESAKRKWNAELLSAVRVAQQTDWDAALWRAEQRVAGALGAKDWDRGADVPVPPVEREGYYHHEDSPAVPTHRVHDALQRTSIVAHAMSAEAQSIAHEAQEVLSVGMEEARGAVSRGVGKAHDLAERARARVHLAEDKAEARVDAKILHLSDIERALEERFDDARREERMKRSVEEVLEERYQPMGGRGEERLV
ncbi:hypothetical protein C8A05DRAFT_47674 [Staphylotrichum tortipilum]|uniref:MICOS complex subunit MIC12 n=1 Tax=Staphylotrichum tortipilum TaxID=2831512 RepID=A0AAN6MBP5_9PEZI|nr:hypothetical protein C8A05DRAFT_47674 [Staphylotrichum longicolle]